MSKSSVGRGLTAVEETKVNVADEQVPVSFVAIKQDVMKSAW